MRIGCGCGAPYGRILRYGHRYRFHVLRSGRHPGAGPIKNDDVHDVVGCALHVLLGPTNGKLGLSLNLAPVGTWPQCSAASQLALFWQRPMRGGQVGKSTQ